MRRIGDSDTITGKYLFLVGNQTAMFQTSGTFAPDLENRTYFPGSNGPEYSIILTESNRQFKSQPGNGRITYLGTENGVLSFLFRSVVFTEEVQTGVGGSFVVNGSGALGDAR